MTEKEKIYRTPIIAGILIIVFFILFQTFSPRGDAGRLLQGTLSIILRVFAALWINQIAKEQGRKSLFFVMLGIITPAVTLIIIGALGNREMQKEEKESRINEMK